jgi:hypothetical protein
MTNSTKNRNWEAPALRGLETEVEALEQALAQAPRDVPDVHPNVADNYRRKVELLT